MKSDPRHTRSLYTLLGVIIVSVVVLVLGSGASFTYYLQRERMHHAIEDDAALSIAALQKNLASFIDAYAVNEYAKLVATEAELHHHFAIVVEDYQMGKIVGKPAYVSGKIQDRGGTLVDFESENVQHQQWLKGTFYRTSAPILAQAGNTLGKVTVYSSDIELRAELQRSLIRNLGNTLIITLLLAALLLITIHRLIVRPLDAVTEALKQHDSDGIPTRDIPRLPYRELSFLTDTMNSMIGIIRRSRDSLQLERSRLHNVIKGTGAGTWEWQVTTGDLVINAQWAEMIGYTLEELLPANYDTWSSRVHPHDIGRSRKLLERHFAGELHEYRNELRMRHKQGHWVWVLALGRISQRDSDGSPLLMSGTHIDISEPKRQEAEILEQRRRLNDILVGTNVGTWEWNVQTGEVEFNERWAGMLGYTLDELLPVSIDTWTQLVHPDDLQRSDELLQQHFSGKRPYYESEVRLRHRDGHWIWVLDRGRVSSRTADGKPLLMAGTHQDITQRKQAEEQLRQSAIVYEYANEGILITDVQGTILDANDTFCRITGYAREEIVGHKPSILKSGKQDQAFYQEMWQSMLELGRWSGEIWNRRKDGTLYAGIETVSLVRDEKGEPWRYVALITDITELKLYQERLEHAAHYDALTNLPNRVLFTDRLCQAMTQSRRRDTRLAIVYLDLDGFKEVNDQHGHETGDKLLQVVSGRMKEVLRDEDTLARVGGDEFVAVLLDLATWESIRLILDRLLEAAALPVYVDELELHVSASVGVTYYPQEKPIEAEQLLRQADQAMYLAKKSGKNRYQIYAAG